MVLSLKFNAVFLLSFSGLLGPALTAAPRLALNTTSIGPVNTTSGANGAAQTVQATNPGDGSLNLTATSSATWLAATVGTRGSCTAANGNCYSVSISLNTSSLAAGAYTEFVTLTDSNAVDSPQDISVTVNVTGVPGSVTTYVAPNGSIRSSTAVNVYTTGTGVRGTVSTQSGNWLSFQQGGGGLVPAVSPWVIGTNALPGQASGTYTGTVVISGSSAASDNKTINVTMVVTSSPIIDAATMPTLRLTAGQNAGPAYGTAKLNNLGQGALTISAAAGSANFLSATVTGSDGLLIKGDPTGLTPGLYTGAITVTSNAANSTQVSVPVELVVAPAGLPSIFAGGIVNVATFVADAVSPGDIAAVFGSQLAVKGTFMSAPALPLPTSIAGTQVLVNGVPAPLYFVSDGQINFQTPYSLTASQTNTVQVVSGATQGNIRSIGVSLAAPRLLPGRYAPYGAIVNATDGSLTIPASISDPAFKTHPAKAGEVIVIYAAGLGQTTPPAVEGLSANDGTAGKPLQTINNVTVIFGGGFSGRPTSATAAFAGLTPTQSGLYQINVKIPSDITFAPSVPVRIVVNGVESNAVDIAVSPDGK